VNLVIAGTTQSVSGGFVDMGTPPSPKISRLVSTFTPNAPLTGIKLVAVVQAGGRAVRCGDHNCTQAEDASITFT
jgi:hypothetical protein